MEYVGWFSRRQAMGSVHRSYFPCAAHDLEVEFEHRRHVQAKPTQYPWLLAAPTCVQRTMAPG